MAELSTDLSTQVPRYLRRSRTWPRPGPIGPAFATEQHLHDFVTQRLVQMIVDVQEKLGIIEDCLGKCNASIEAVRHDQRKQQKKGSAPKGNRDRSYTCVQVVGHNAVEAPVHWRANNKRSQTLPDKIVDADKDPLQSKMRARCRTVSSKMAESDHIIRKLSYSVLSGRLPVHANAQAIRDDIEFSKIAPPSSANRAVQPLPLDGGPSKGFSRSTSPSSNKDPVATSERQQQDGPYISSTSSRTSEASDGTEEWDQGNLEIDAKALDFLEMQAREARVQRVLYPNDGRRISTNSSGSCSSCESQYESITRLRTVQNYNLRFAAKVWNFFEFPDSSASARRYARFVQCFIVGTVLLSLSHLTQHFKSPPDDVTFFVACELAVEGYFVTELLLRFLASPDHNAFLRHPYNVIDLVNVLVFAIRASIDFIVQGEDSFSSVWGMRNLIWLFVPLLRATKVLRRFRLFQLLFVAFMQVLEALPVMLYAQMVITLVFAPLIFIAEPRDNIADISGAIWLTIVSMTTVGYGDVVPTTMAGHCIVSALVIISMICIAFPVGMIGSTFTSVWTERGRILLLQRTRDCLDMNGYTKVDVTKLFKLVDIDGEGELNIDRFGELLQQMHIGLAQDDVNKLFRTFDLNENNRISTEEFVGTLFPSKEAPSSSRGVSQ